MKTFLRIFTACLCCTGFAYSQSIQEKEKTLRSVFNKIVAVYGDEKNPPRLELISNAGNEKIIAVYSIVPGPVVRIDEKLYDLCIRLDDDSLNALSIILAHELAHHYGNHTFCLDYAYAMDKKSPYKKEFIRIHADDASKMEKEIEADEKSLFYSAAAGYKPFGVFKILLDEIYKAYKLGNVMKGYPSKTERKDRRNLAAEKSYKLLAFFQAGKILKQVGDYENAAACFNEVEYFPSRENYNNAGVVKLLAAWKLKPGEHLSFIYPFQLDPVSRLRERGRGSDWDREKFDSLLKAAEKDFRIAVGRDEHYVMAVINLACLKDIAGNPKASLGALVDIPASDSLKFVEPIKLIKAIATFHDDPNSKEASEQFDQLQRGIDSITDYDINLFNLRNELSNDAMDSYIKNWKIRNEVWKTPTPEQKEYFKKNKQACELFNDIPGNQVIRIWRSKQENTIEIYINSRKLLTAVPDINPGWIIIKMDDQWYEKNKNRPQWILMRDDAK